MPPNEDALDVFLRFVQDEEAVKRVQKGISSVEGELAKLGTTSDKVNASIADNLNKGLEENDKKVRAAAEAFETKLAPAMNAQIEKSEELQRQHQKLIASFRQTRTEAQRLGQISQIGIVASTVLLGGMYAWANKFVKDAKTSTEITRQWKVETASLEASQSRVGGTIATTILPLLTKAAELADAGSKFVEKHPEIIKAALNTGLIVGGLSAVGMLVSKGIRLYADVGYLLATTTQATAADKMLLAATTQATAANTMAKGGIGGLLQGAGAKLGMAAQFAGAIAIDAGAIIIGTEAGLALGNAIGKAIYGSGYRPQGLGDVANTFRQLQLAPVAGFLSLMNKIAPSTKDVNAKFWNALMPGTDFNKQGILGGTKGTSTPSVGNYLSTFSQDNVQTYIDYSKQIIAAGENEQKQLLNLEKATEDQRTRIVSQAGKARVQEDKQFTEAWYSDLRDFQQSETDKQEDENRTRLERARKYGKDVLRAEQDHQIAMRQLLEDHQQKVQDLAVTRDALGIVRENRAYNLQKSREEGKYQLEAQRRSADFASEIADLEENNRIDRQRRERDFYQKMREMEAQHQEQLKAIDAQEKDDLDQLAAQKQEQETAIRQAYDDQVKTIRDSFIEKMRSLDSTILGDTAAYQRYLSTMSQQFRDWINQQMGNQAGTTTATTQATTAPKMPKALSRQTGGYAWVPGQYNLAEGAVPEFVMNGSTTKMAERAIGSQLTQAALVSALTKGAGKTINDNRKMTFNGMTAADRAWYRNIARQEALEAVTEEIRDA
jgi:Tfp pilus assembly protein FimT